MYDNNNKDKYRNTHHLLYLAGYELFLACDKRDALPHLKEDKSHGKKCHA